MIYMQKYKIQRQYIFSTKTYKEVAQFLDHECEESLNLMAIKDEKGNTALHQCAYFNSVKVMQKYLEHMERYITDKGLESPIILMDQFVNLKNDEGLTAAHFAAYKGHYPILELLEKNKADICCTSTAHQQNILHLAAQNDKVETFIYYFNSALDINKPDLHRQTALHMAAQRNCESVVTYLLAQPNILINCQDNVGQTPLHYATAYGNTKIVKRLLKAGADRNIKNSGSQTALDIAKRHEFRSICRLLDQDFSLMDRIKIFMNLKTEYRPHKKSWKKPILFIILFLVYLGLRFYAFQLHDITQYVEIAFYTLVLVLYMLLLIPNKKMHKKEYKYFLYSYQGNLRKVCLVCVSQKPRRSLHCDVCGRCIQRYDHHCYWINNCVGRFNHNMFIAFISLFLLLLLVVGFLGGLVLYNLIRGQENWIHFQGSHYGRLSSLVFSSFCLVVFAIFIVPVLMLLAVQIKNLCLNKTTYQRFTKDKAQSFAQSSSHIISEQIKISKKKSKGRYSFQNVRLMCFGSEGDLQKPLKSDSSVLDSA